MTHGRETNRHETSRREQLAIEALREIAKRDPHGSGRFAEEVLRQIEHVDETHMQQQTGYDKERADRLTNMAAQRMGDVHHNPKTMGPMSVQEIETGPGNMAQKTIDWNDPRKNLQPQTPEAYKMPHGMPQDHLSSATDRREDHEKAQAAHEENRKRALEAEKQHSEKEGKEGERAQHEHADQARAADQKKENDLREQDEKARDEHLRESQNDVQGSKGRHDLKASHLTVEKPGGGFDDKKKK